MVTSAETFRHAVAHHQAGRLREAEALYRQILDVEPRHADAVHLLGLVAHQCGRHETAIELISRAILLSGGQAAYHSNLGEVYRALARPAEACQCYRQALRLKPDYAEAHNNLGNALLAMGQLAEAEASYREALRFRPDFAEPYNNLGLIRQRHGNTAAAIELFRQALAVNPVSPSAIGNLGGALKALGQIEEALVLVRQAIATCPQSAELHAHLGMLYQGQRDFTQAEGCYRESLRLNPFQPQIHHNLGVALRELGQRHEAIDSYREALRLDPRLAAAYGGLGIVLNDLGQHEAACEAYREALAIAPQDPVLLRDYGVVLEGQGRLDEALKLYEQAIGLQGDFAEAHFSAGSVYQTAGKPEQAIASYERALAIKPDYVAAINNLSALYNDLSRPDQALEYAERGLAIAPDMAALHANRQVALHAQGRADEAVAAGRRAAELRPHDAAEHSNYLYTLNFHPGYDAETVFHEHLAWARRHAEPLTALAPPHTNDRTPDRRLRVGYVSPYFRQHAVNYFVEPILASHDHRRFEVFCYADQISADAATARLKEVVDSWRDVRYRSDEELADLVRRDGIDILVDLTGHIGGNRMLLFARKPAPVQVTCIGYQNTTGMSAMVYRLSDAHADPPGRTDRYYTERLVRLPRCFFCFRPSDDAPQVTPLPARAHGCVTFGSFNNFAKVTPAVREAWWRILQRTANSRLYVLAYQGGYLERTLKADAVARGIDPSRVELFDKRPHGDYLALLNEVDIALDPFPFNGHTTTCDAIWQGVPVVMLEGDSYVSRFGGSVLANVGLESLISRSVDGYVDAAVALAADEERLAALRAGLRDTMSASPLLDFAGFTRNLEQAYRRMWQAWCGTPQAASAG